MTVAEQTKVRILTGLIKTFFDILTDILLKISGGTLYKNKEFSKIFSPYMLCRYISMKSNLNLYAQILNQLQTIITPQQLYIVAYKLIPKQKCGFISYIKKPKEKILNGEETTEENINTNNSVKMSIFDL